MDHADHVALIRAAVSSASPQDGGGTTWADLGSGQGAFTLALAELLPVGSQIVSVDRDGRALAEQRARMDRQFPAATVTYLVADFTRPLALPTLDGLLMANSVHFVRDKPLLLDQLLRLVRPGGRFVLVEYDADHGNPYVPYPISFTSWEQMARELGLTETQLAKRVPSRFLGAIYCAVSVVPGSDVA